MQSSHARRYRPMTWDGLERLPQFARLPESRRRAMGAVARVLPFRVSPYVVRELIDWDDIPADPIFQLIFPQPGMLRSRDVSRIAALLDAGADPAALKAAANEIRLGMNPHPAGQLEHNVPTLDGRPLGGVQHKYRETVLCFPARGQTCHAYCTYCFRWAQFVGMEDLRFTQRNPHRFHEYLRRHTEVTDVLFTGGDPLVMRAAHLAAFIRPLLTPQFGHIRDIRIGTKALAFWPYRFTTDDDADTLLGLFKEVVTAGRHLALMAHFSHPRELDTAAVREAIRRIRDTGAVVRTQAPLVRHVNALATAWAEMWRRQVALGCVPYYMFVERDTGPRDYFQVPLAEAHDIFTRAFRRVSGLARTVRGPSMSAEPGKVVVLGTQQVMDDKVFVLAFLQGRRPEWVGRPFFARFDPQATWLDELRPIDGDRFFFERTAAPGRGHVPWAPGAGETIRTGGPANRHDA